MIKGKKIALLLDVDNVKISGEAFNELYARLNEIGDVVYCKFYGYNDRKHIYLSDAISKYGYETAPFMRFKKRLSQLDIRIIVDAIKLNYTKPEIDTYCIVAGNGDLIPCLVELKSCGKTIIDINTIYQEQNYHMFDAHINLMSINAEVQTYVSKTKKETSKKSTIKTKTTKSSQVQNAAISSNKATITAKQTEEVFEEVGDGGDGLGDILRDITTRYTELDFSTNSDMSKKYKLISDIEKLINSETKSGEGLNSKNADIRQIFVELQNIVSDMKNAINETDKQ